MTELLAPAGDLECLDTALRFGADAVYCGGPMLQLRASAAGFDVPRLEEAVQRVHRAGKKLYVTVNCFTRCDELEPLRGYARLLHSLGVDAVIVSDLGAIATVREAVPELEVHVSTQANCMNDAAARVYRQMGVHRIVLAREMSLEEIRLLRDRIPPELELEAFVHGAMCMAYSGRCFISSYLTGRSGNRGECTQPCRWSYHLMEENRPGEFFPVEEDAGGTTLLSSRDMNCLCLLDKLRAAGVCSFKLEGRMKAPYYVATVVNAYRRALDHTAPADVLERELECASHRPYCTGFYEGALKKYTPENTPYEQSCVFVGTVLAAAPGEILVEQRNRFSLGETLEVLSPRGLGESFTVESIRTEEGEETGCANHAQQRVHLSCPLTLAPGDFLRRRKEADR